MGRACAQKAGPHDPSGRGAIEPLGGSHGVFGWGPMAPLMPRRKGSASLKATACSRPSRRDCLRVAWRRGAARRGAAWRGVGGVARRGVARFSVAGLLRATVRSAHGWLRYWPTAYWGEWDWYRSINDFADSRLNQHTSTRPRIAASLARGRARVPSPSA